MGYVKLYDLDWPPSPEQWANVNEMLRLLFDGLQSLDVKTATSGVAGVAGARGPIGPAGDDGEDGPPGPPGSGAPGATGAAGPTGATGPVGIAINGDDGDDGWPLPGPRGATGTAPATTEFTVTTTGNIDDLDFSNANVIRMNNASLSTLRGLKAGTAGQLVTIVSVGAGQVDLAHQNAGSTAANRMINFATSASTNLGAGAGVATYVYDATTARWRLADHDQGAWISPAYNAGDFTGSGTITWTVAAGDVSARRYFVRGRTMYMTYAIDTSTVAGAGNQLFIAVPGGFTAAGTSYGVIGNVIDNGAATTGYYRANTAGDVIVGHIRTDAASFAASVDNTYLRGTDIFDIQ